MKVQTLALLAGCAFLAASCGTTKTYSVNAKSGTQTGGTAKFTQNGNEVTMKLDITMRYTFMKKETVLQQTERLPEVTGILPRMIMVNGVPNISIWEI